MVISSVRLSFEAALARRSRFIDIGWAWVPGPSDLCPGLSLPGEVSALSSVDRLLCMSCKGGVGTTSPSVSSDFTVPISECGGKLAVYSCELPFKNFPTIDQLT